MAPSMGRNADMIRNMKFGFWVGTRQAPRRAVKWEPTRLEDGRETLRGKNWVEVMEHGESREPERFHGADVENVGPHEWLTYYPAVNEPVCGWMESEGQYCPRPRAVTSDAVQPFCRRHEDQLQGEEEHGGEEQGDTRTE